MTINMQQAKYIENIAIALRNRDVDFSHVPFDYIVNCIQNIYEQVTRKGDEFVLLYGGQITRGLENRDYDAVADILQILVYHLRLIEIYNMKKSEFYGKMTKLKCERDYFNNLLKLRDREDVQGKNEYTPFQGKGVIYSAIIGAYDNLKEPRFVDPNFDYILFTDNPNLKSKIWKIQLIENLEQLDNNRLSKKIKILGHKYLQDYDYSIWVDGSFEIVDDLKEYIDCYKRNEPMLSFNHHGNDCIYDEIKTCKTLNKDDDRLMDEQIERYRLEGYPEHYGLTANGILVRDIHNVTVKRVMEHWWKEVENGSCRDQLSFCYVCWKENFMYDTCDMYILDNKYVRIHAHNKVVNI